MPQKILIASDSTTDLSPEQVAKYGVKIMPLCVSVGGKNYTDGVDINPDMIYENYEKTGQLPKTAALNVSEFTDFFEIYPRGLFDSLIHDKLRYVKYIQPRMPRRRGFPGRPRR